MALNSNSAFRNELKQIILILIMMWNQSSEDGGRLRVTTVAEACRSTRRDRFGGREKDLCGAFTRYVKALEKRGEPTRKEFDEMWNALSVTIKGHLRKSCLLGSSPRYLGVFGYERWTQEGGCGKGGVSAPLNDFMSDCYMDVFLKRLGRLQAQLKVKGDIDGLVVIYIRNYIHDRRKAHDPLGFRVFEILRMALRAAVRSGELNIVKGDPKFRGDTVLAFAAAEGPVDNVAFVDFGDVAHRWNSELLLDIMTAVGAARQALLKRLRFHVLELQSQGVHVFQFRDLVDAVKKDARILWASLYDQEGGDSVPGRGEDGVATMVRLVQPDPGPEIRDSFRELDNRVVRRLERLDVPVKTLQYLRNLWGYLGSYANNNSMDTLPSNRKISVALSIPRERLPGLYETLGEVIG